MTKAELIDAIAQSKSVPEGLSKKAIQAVVDSTFEEMRKSIKKDERFSFPGFGTFSKKKRSARTGRNPQTGEEIKIKAQTTVGFKPAQALKDFVGKGK
ncbi:MAG: HU family DNA-binding protein [Myxococcota bacterium]|jgi:DNA-binding protein HU-beta|nr:HU family DNA-binding protein [Myxococcota bacterium]